MGGRAGSSGLACMPIWLPAGHGALAGCVRAAHPWRGRGKALRRRGSPATPAGIEKHGVVEVGGGERVYAYEVDGKGASLTDFDDPNGTVSYHTAMYCTAQLEGACRLPLSSPLCRRCCRRSACVAGGLGGRPGALLLGWRWASGQAGALRRRPPAPPRAQALTPLPACPTSPLQSPPSSPSPCWASLTTRRCMRPHAGACWTARPTGAGLGAAPLRAGGTMRGRQRAAPARQAPFTPAAACWFWCCRTATAGCPGAFATCHAALRPGSASRPCIPALHPGTAPDPPCAPSPTPTPHPPTHEQVLL